MTNAQRGEATITLGGATFPLRYDMNAIATIETELGGDSVLYTMARGDRMIGIRFLRAALYAGMLHDKEIAKGLTIEKVGKLITGVNIGEVTSVVSRALAATFGLKPQESDDPLAVSAAASSNDAPTGQVG